MVLRKLLGFNRKKPIDSDDKHPTTHDVSSAHQAPSPGLDVCERPLSRRESALVTSTSASRTQSWTASYKINNHSFQTNSEGSPLETSTLGLQFVYSPQNDHKADIVFVHGLGGTSRNTWSKSKDPALFWPGSFLPLEPDICCARVFTFGYNAKVWKGESVKSILNFAKDLLFDLKFAQDVAKNEVKLGQVPLVFVVHSMGGLVVKEAYLQGQNDPEYASIIKSISGIVFLSTPHRGTNLAQALDSILRTTTFANPKQYISDMGRHSLVLEKLNEQFRHVAPKLDIVSLYETKPTPIGLKGTKVMILEKESSVLGYPGEISKPLDANHNNICKYESPQDPNYVAVRDVLRFLLTKAIESDPVWVRPLLQDQSSLMKLKEILSIQEDPSHDFDFHRDKWVPGTSDWILQTVEYTKWQEEGPQNKALWLSGGSASGKSVMTSFIINELSEAGYCTQYFFLQHGHRKKSSTSDLLRSMAYQCALKFPEFLARVLEVAEGGIGFDTAGSRVIWDRLFRSILFRLELQEKPLYWVVDGVDEAEDHRSLVRLLLDIHVSAMPIRLLLVSRDSASIKACFKKVPGSLEMSSMGIHSGLDEDLRHYVSCELRVPGSDDYREDVAHRILERAQSNFLWVKLAVDQINECHREADVEAAFEELPGGMEALYDRMASSVAKILTSPRKILVERMLWFTTCAVRALTVSELSQALGEHAEGMLDLETSIVDLCSGFVSLDHNKKAVMAHQSAREYLLDTEKDHPFSINHCVAQEQLLIVCLDCLMKPDLRGEIAMNQQPDFVDYAATSWASHLFSTTIYSWETFRALKRFLSGPWVLTWIEYLASTRQLHVLYHASRAITAYARNSKSSQLEETLTVSATDSDVVESWAIDMVKVLGKFGEVLRRNPKAIYKLVAPFCPRTSAIYQQFGRKETKSIQVSGLLNEKWDDAIARIYFEDNAVASAISVAGAYIFVLVATGKILVYDSFTFEQISSSPVNHGERVYLLQPNDSGTHFVTYGYRTTKIWDTSKGEVQFSVANLKSRPRPLCIRFAKDRSVLFIGFDDSKIRSIDMETSDPAWELVTDLEESELEGFFLNAASLIALSEDGNLAAVAYRGHPLSAWQLKGPTHICHCWRSRAARVHGEVVDAVWLPHSTELLGIYIEGVIFKWNPYMDEVEERGTGSKRLSLSSDGKLFATGDGRGTVMVFLTSDFSPIYQLNSQDSVLNVAFSPISNRFLDIRGEYATVWEPHALMSITEDTSRGTREAGSDVDNIAQPVSTFCPRIDAITALATYPKGLLYFCGTRRGTLQVHHTKLGRQADLYTSGGFLTIEHITCSDDGLWVSSCDNGRMLRIFEVQRDTDGKAGTTHAFDARSTIDLGSITHGIVLQLIFHKDTSQLLVRASSSLHVICLRTFKVVHSREDLDNDTQRWILHPTNTALIIGFDVQSCQLLDWSLAECGTYDYGLSAALALHGFDASSPGSLEVSQALATWKGKQVFLEVCEKDSCESTRKIHLFIETTLLLRKHSDGSGPTNISTTILRRETTSRIFKPLAFLSYDRLIFLSDTSSVCSFQVPSGSIKDLFYLPSDWISQDGLDLCRIWEVEKAFLCSRNGEVAVVKSVGLIQ